MSATTSQRASTSTGLQTNQQDLLCLLLGSETLLLIKENKLKLVPIDQEESCPNCDEAKETVNCAEAENESLKTLVSDHERKLEEAGRRITELEGDGELRGQLETSNCRREELELQIATQSETFTELQHDVQTELESERIRRDEAESRVNLLEDLLKQKEEENESMKKKMKEDFDKNQARVNTLCNQKEMITNEKFKFAAFARQIKNQSNFDEPNDDLLKNNQLNRIADHVQQIFQKRHVENLELNRNRELMKKMGEIFKAHAQLPSSGAQLSPTCVHASMCQQVFTPSASVLPSSDTMSASAVSPSSPEEPIILPRNFIPLSPLAAEVATPTPAWNANSVPQNASMTTNTTNAVVTPTPLEPSLPSEPCSSNGPSIVIPLKVTLPDQNQNMDTVVHLPQPQSSSPSIVSSNICRSDVGNSTKTTKRKNSRYNHNGQLTEYTVTTKTHGVNKACSQWKCLCGNSYSNEKSLNVHVRKMTKPWKYRCPACRHYFFYKSDLDRHLTRSGKCGVNIPGDGMGSGDVLLDELLGLQGPAPSNIHQPPSGHQPSTIVAMPSDIITSSNVPVPKTRNIRMRKLQQSILRRKKHAPWLSNKGPVQGVWYCVCGSKFSSKSNLDLHTQYFTREWKFKCELCPNETFFYLCYLKKHMASTHKIKEPLSEYKMGCQLCGSLFKNGSDYYRHRKITHNLHRNVGTAGNGGIRKPRRTPLSSSSKSASATPPVSQSSPTESTIPVCPPNPSEPITPAFPSTSTASETLSASSTCSIIYVPTTSIAEPINQEIIDVPSDDDGDIDQDITIISTAVVVKQEVGVTGGSEPREDHAEVVPDNPNAQQFPCRCGKTYYSRRSLMSHINTMKFGNIFVCLECTSSFSQYVGLQTHTAMKHKQELFGFKCGFCGLCFSSTITFKKHCLKVHDH